MTEVMENEIIRKNRNGGNPEYEKVNQQRVNTVSVSGRGGSEARREKLDGMLIGGGEGRKISVHSKKQGAREVPNMTN